MSNQIIDIQIPPYKLVETVSRRKIMQKEWELHKEINEILRSMGIDDINEEEDPFEREQKIREKMREATSRIIELSKDVFVYLIKNKEYYMSSVGIVGVPFFFFSLAKLAIVKPNLNIVREDFKIFYGREINKLRDEFFLVRKLFILKNYINLINIFLL